MTHEACRYGQAPCRIAGIGWLEGRNVCIFLYGLKASVLRRRRPVGHVVLVDLMNAGHI